MIERKYQYGRSYVNCKALSDDLASLVVADKCEMGGNIEKTYVLSEPLTEVANQYKLWQNIVNKVWHSHNTENTGQSRGRPKMFDRRRQRICFGL